MKISKNDLYSYLLGIWSFAFITLISSNFIEIEYMGKLYGAIWLVVRISLICIIFSNIKRSRDVFVIISLMLLLIVSLYYTNYPKTGEVETIVLFILAAKNIDLRNAIKSLLISHCFAFIVVVCSSHVGLIENSVMPRMDGTIRQTWGFSHPNHFGAVVLHILVMYIYLKKGLIRWDGYIYMLLCMLLVYVVPNSQTAFMMIVYLMVLCITNNVRNSKIRLINKWAGDIINSLRFLIIVIAIITIGIAAGLIDETILPVMESDSTLQSRIVQMILYYQTYGVSLFGTAIEISTEQGNSDLFTLDNGYAYLLLMYGVVIFLLFIFCYFCIAKRAAKEKNYEKIIAISIFAIVGFNETNMLRLVNNFTLLFFAELLWNSKQVTEKNIKWNVPPIS